MTSQCCLALFAERFREGYAWCGFFLPRLDKNLDQFSFWIQVFVFSAVSRIMVLQVKYWHKWGWWFFLPLSINIKPRTLRLLSVICVCTLVCLCFGSRHYCWVWCWNIPCSETGFSTVESPNDKNRGGGGGGYTTARVDIVQIWFQSLTHS